MRSVKRLHCNKGKHDRLQLVLDNYMHDMDKHGLLVRPSDAFGVVAAPLTACS